MQQSGLPGGISDHFRVVFTDPLGVLHELQALVLLVDEVMFFPIGLSALALKRQKEESGQGGISGESEGRFFWKISREADLMLVPQYRGLTALTLSSKYGHQLGALFNARKVKVSQSCLTLCNPMDYGVHGIL